MPSVFVTQDKVALYYQPDGANTPATILSIDKNGMADKTRPNPGREVIWGRDAFGRFLPKIVYPTPPGGINTSTVEEDDLGTWTFLQKMYDFQGCFPLQERWYKCGRLDGPAWTRVRQMGQMTITQQVNSAGPNRAATAEPLFNSFEVSWRYTITLFQHALAALTISEDQNINDIAGLGDLVVGCQNCFPGYAPDQILYLAVDHNAGSPGDYANVWYSTNGGGTWAITSTNPFTNSDDILFILISFISETQFRVIVVADTTTAQLKYSDFTLGDEGTSSWSTGTTIGAAAVSAIAWLFYNRIYIAVDGDIYISDDQGATVGSAIYTGTPALNAFAKSPVDGSVWAVGATNTILRELGQSDTFEAMVGPTGGGAFTAVTIAGDGRIYAGNGASLYVSTNGALNAGGWTSLKNFGANHAVKKINLAGESKFEGGDSQLIRVVVDDTTAGVPGEVWESVDGGGTWVQVSELGTQGYNAAYFSSVDDNLAIIVGDSGTVQKLSSKAI